MKHLPYPLSFHAQTVMLSSVWTEKFHSSMSFELLHVMDGHIELTFQNGNRSFRGACGDTLFVPVRTMHCDRFDSREDLKIFYVFFQWTPDAETLSSFSNERLLCMPEDVRREVRFLFERMRDDKQADIFHPEIFRARLYTVLNLLYHCRTSQDQAAEKAHPATGPSRQEQLVRDARAYMKRNFAQPLRLDDVAEHLGISPYYLSRLFPGQAGFTFYEYLTDLRMEYARELLCGGGHTIDEVAALTGYESGNYFAKVFRRRTGMTPGRYRKAHQEKVVQR